MNKIILPIAIAFFLFACKESKNKNVGSIELAQSQSQKSDSTQLQFRVLTFSNKGESLPNSVIPRYQLIDESAKDPSFIEFKNGLISELEKSDTQAIFSHFQEDELQCMSPEKARFAFDLGSGENKSEQMKQFFQTNLSNGGYLIESLNATSDSGYSAPGIQFISGTAFGDWCVARDCGVIAKDGSDLYDMSNGQQKIITHLMGNEIVATYKVDSLPDPKWRWVIRHNGQKGFVPADKIVSQNDAGIIFRKSSGKWKICWVIGTTLRADPNAEEANGD